MKKYYGYCLLALSISLLIYVSYRDQHTVINVMLSQFLPHVTLNSLHFLQQHFPLPYFILYNLPEGLWIFSITLCSRNMYTQVGNSRFSLTYLPILYAIALELLQLFHITDGRFDLLDILTSLLFWSVANYLVSCPHQPLIIHKRLNYRTAVLFTGYSIVYLSDILLNTVN